MYPECMSSVMEGKQLIGFLYMMGHAQTLSAFQHCKLEMGQKGNHSPSGAIDLARWFSLSFIFQLWALSPEGLQDGVWWSWFYKPGAAPPSNRCTTWSMGFSIYSRWPPIPLLYLASFTLLPLIIWCALSLLFSLAPSSKWPLIISPVKY